MEQISGCQAVERAITILELFDEHRTVVGVGDAAKALGVHRSTASRLMATLERRGLLEQAEGSASYRLGLGLVPLAGFVLNRFPVRAQAGQVLRELRDATGETAWLGVLDAHKITYLDQASSRHVTVNVDWVGVRHELTEGVTGRLLLAYQPGDVIDRLVAEAPAERAGPVRHRAGTGAPAGSRHPHQRGRGRLLWRRGADPRCRRHGGCRDRPRRPAVPRLRAEGSRRAAAGGTQRRCARVRGAGSPGRLMNNPRRGFYPVAALSGLSFGVLAVAVPLHVAAMHRPASLAGRAARVGHRRRGAGRARRRCRRQDGGQRP